MPPLPPGGPHTLTARDIGGEAVATDVLLGAVWLGSGQSNMEWQLSLTKGAEADIAAAEEPRLRVFTVVKRTEASGPCDTLDGCWQLCTPREAPSFSAVGYYFGRRMVAETGLPFGMVISAWGGSAIAPWLPHAILASRPDYAAFMAEVEAARGMSHGAEAYQMHEDPGIAARANGWSAPGLDDSGWDLLPVPGQWQDSGWAFNGAVWLRLSVEIPRAWVGRDLELSLGIVDDFDTTFVNGERVGGIGKETPNWWTRERHHKVPAGLVKAPTVHIAIRVFDTWGNGGVLGSVRLRPMDAPEQAALQLNGQWRAKAELKLALRSPGGPATAPTSLYNAMINPLLGAGLDGFLWYQGESDTGRARLYQRLLTDLIGAWRSAFGAAELPFGIVQLASYQQRKDYPSEDPWADLREAQRLVALTVPACGLAVAIDAGEADDIHPRYKKTVGERLAEWALRQAHGRAGLPYSGPLPAEAWREAGGLRVRFVHADGLRVRVDGLRGFELSGDGCSWFKADAATIAGDTVHVSAAGVLQPAAVRYAWQGNPETTLENGAGLPASPFQIPTSL